MYRTSVSMASASKHQFLDRADAYFHVSSDHIAVDGKSTPLRKSLALSCKVQILLADVSHRRCSVPHDRGHDATGRFPSNWQLQSTHPDPPSQILTWCPLNCRTRMPWSSRTAWLSNPHRSYSAGVFVVKSLDFQ